MDEWQKISTEPRDGSKIWLCRMINGAPTDIRPGISSNLPTTWPTHWKRRYEPDTE